MNTKSPKSRSSAILVTGLIAGALDITAAIIQFMIPEPRNPMRIFEYIASGIFGNIAFTGGPIMAVAGLIFHFLIAAIWSLLFFLLYPHIEWIGKNKVPAGLVYGIWVWVIMNMVVLPLSNVPHFPVQFPRAFIGMGILMVAIGLPVSMLADRYYRRKM